jgi:zinc protease
MNSERQSGHSSEHQLDNGLTVLLRESHQAPVISFWVLYRVGSRNEHCGITGASHWAEHMMFKGTPKYPASVLDKTISRNGASWNAQTDTDYTAYYETMPADRIDLAPDLEADRMTGALFDPEEVASERTVIISERQGAENDPMFLLSEEIHGAAFRVHPYHHDVIGDMADLMNMTRDDLYNHYRTYYHPNNAIVAAVGAFRTEDMLEKIKGYFGDIPAGPVPPAVTREEPPQYGERRVRVEREGKTSFMQAAYHAPRATDPDYFPLVVLDSILSGPGSIPGGGGIGNKTSRLYQALIESEIAVHVSGGVRPTVDPYLYAISVVVRDGHTCEEAEAALDPEITRIQNEPVTEKELVRAKKQARAAFAYGTESVTRQAFSLAYMYNIAETTRWYEEYLDHLTAVTAGDVMEAAQKWLRPSQRTVGWYIPTGGGTE